MTVIGTHNAVPLARTSRHLYLSVWGATLADGAPFPVSAIRPTRSAHS